MPKWAARCAALFLLLLAGHAVAAPPPAAPPSAVQSVDAGADSRARWEALEKRAQDAETKIAVLEANGKMEERARDTLSHSIDFFAILITVLVLAFSISSFFFAGERAARAARAELEKDRLKVDALMAEAVEASKAAAAAQLSASQAAGIAHKAQTDAENAARAALAHHRRAEQEADGAAEKHAKIAAAAVVADTIAKQLQSKEIEKPTPEQIETISEGARASAATPEDEWSVDQFKTAIANALYVDKDHPEAARLSAKMAAVHHDDDEAYANAHNRLGDAKREQGKFVEAIAAYRKVIARLGEIHTRWANEECEWSRLNLGFSMIEIGKPKDAESELRAGLDLCHDLYGAEASSTLVTRHVLIRSILAQGRAAEAENMFSELLPIRIRVDGAEAPGTLTTHHGLGRSMLAQGRAAEAENIFRELLPIRIRVAGAEASGTLVTRHEFARSVLDQGLAAKAESMLRELLPICERVDGSEVSGTLVTRHELARSVLYKGQAAEAEAMFCELLPICERVDGPEATNTLVIRYFAALASFENGHLDQAQRMLDAIPDLSGHQDWVPRHTAKLAYVRGRVAYALGQTDEGIAYLREAQRIWADIFPPDHPDRKQTDEYLNKWESSDD